MDPEGKYGVPEVVEAEAVTVTVVGPVAVAFVALTGTGTILHSSDPVAFARGERIT